MSSSYNLTRSHKSGRVAPSGSPPQLSREAGKRLKFAVGRIDQCVVGLPRLHIIPDSLGLLQPRLERLGKTAVFTWRILPAASFPEYKTDSRVAPFIRIFSVLGTHNVYDFKLSHGYHHRYTLHPTGNREVVRLTCRVLYLLQLFTFNIAGGYQSSALWPFLRGTVVTALNRYPPSTGDGGDLDGEWMRAIYHDAPAAAPCGPGFCCCTWRHPSPCRSPWAFRSWRC